MRRWNCQVHRALQVPAANLVFPIERPWYRLPLSVDRRPQDLLWEKDSSVDPSPFLAEYTVLFLIVVEVERQQELLEIDGEKKSRKLDGMESTKAKSDAHFMHGWDECKHADNLSHAMWCAMSKYDDARLNKTNKKTKCTFTYHISSFRCIVLVLVFTSSLVSDVLSFGFTTHT